MVYNPLKKEHRHMYAVPTSLDGVKDGGTVWRQCISKNKNLFIFRR